MRLTPIIEQRGVSRHAASVEYTEYGNTPETEDTVVGMYEINGTVTVESDPFATGDSPTESTFEPVSAIDKKTGKPVSLQQLLARIPEDQYQELVDRAIN